MGVKIDLCRLTQRQAAELAGVTARALRDWSGVPRNKDGSYPGPGLVEWLIRRAAGDEEFSDQRERLNAAQAEKVEMENAIRRGQIADLNDVERYWTDAVAAARSKLLGIPTKLGPQLVNVGDAQAIAGLIRAEVYAALTELAAYEPPEPTMNTDTRTDEAADLHN